MPFKLIGTVNGGLTGRLGQDYNSENDVRHPRIHTLSQFTSIRTYINHENITPFHPPRPRELLPSMLSRSPPGRSSTLPPIQRRDKTTRPRKSSTTQNNRRPKHDRMKSKEFARRLSIEGRKACSAEPQGIASVLNKRWEDLIEAATSANEADSDRDLTPVRRFFFPWLTSILTDRGRCPIPRRSLSVPRCPRLLLLWGISKRTRPPLSKML